MILSDGEPDATCCAAGTMRRVGSREPDSSSRQDPRLRTGLQSRRNSGCGPQEYPSEPTNDRAERYGGSAAFMGGRGSLCLFDWSGQMTAPGAFQNGDDVPVADQRQAGVGAFGTRELPPRVFPVSLR